MSKKDKQYKLALMLYCLEDFDPPISPEQWQWYKDNHSPEMIDNLMSDKNCSTHDIWKNYMAQAEWILEMIGGDDDTQNVL